MKKIEIIQNVEEIKDIELVKLTEYQLLDLINKDGLIEVLTNYEVPEDFILKWGPGDSEFSGIDKSIVISIMNLSEDFIKAALIIEYFTLDDISELNMSTYSGLSEEFINEYESYINWSRMILYLSSSDKIENIEKFESIIEKHNLWNLISANALPIDFIRKNKEKIDWKIVSIVNEFTEEEKTEFNDLIIKYTDVVPNLDEIDEVYTVSDIRKLIKLSNANQDRDIIVSSTEDLKSKLDRVNKVEEENLRFEVKHKIERLTREDLLKIKETIRQSETKKSS
jgi:hypothetical protein